jgi:hypothetical protein
MLPIRLHPHPATRPRPAAAVRLQSRATPRRRGAWAPRQAGPGSSLSSGAGRRCQGTSTTIRTIDSRCSRGRSWLPAAAPAVHRARRTGSDRHCCYSVRTKFHVQLPHAPIQRRRDQRVVGNAPACLLGDLPCRRPLRARARLGPAASTSFRPGKPDARRALSVLYRIRVSRIAMLSSGLRAWRAGLERYLPGGPSRRRTGPPRRRRADRAD